MTLYPRQFVALMDGRAGGMANVASLPIQLGARFSAQTEIVMMRHDYAYKIVSRHHIRFEDFVYIQKSIDFGYMLRGRDPRYLEFIFIENELKYRHYLLVLKVARYGLEVWVQTFHRTDEGTLRSKLRKLELLRPHA